MVGDAVAVTAADFGAGDVIVAAQGGASAEELAELLAAFFAAAMAVSLTTSAT
jgi:hypothetical protein